MLLFQAGRFTYQKNYDFTIDVIKMLKNTNCKFRLFLAGDGMLEDKIREKVRRYNLDEKVVFLGVVENIDDYMCAADVFLLPSNHEGLGIVAIEAQYAGLRVLASDNVPYSAKISENIKFLPLDENIWVSEIGKNVLCNRDEKIECPEYSAVVQAERYSKILCDFIDCE